MQAKSKFILNSAILYIVFVFISLFFATSFNNVYQDVKNSFLKENTPYLVLKSDGYFSYNDALNKFDQATLKCATVIYEVSNDQEYKVPNNNSNYSSTTKNKVYDLHYPKLMSTNIEIVENHKLLFGEKAVMM